MNNLGWMDGLTFNAFSIPLFSVCETDESFGASSYKCMIIVTSMKCVCVCVCVCVRERERERARNILHLHLAIGQTHSAYFSSYHQLQLVAYNVSEHD